MTIASPVHGGTHRLLKRFLRLLLPVFLIASSFGLYGLGKLTFGDERNQLAARIGNVVARTASAINRLPQDTPRLQIDSILGLLLADPAINCAVVTSGSQQVLASAPARLACQGTDTVAQVDVPLVKPAGAVLSVRYHLGELAKRSRLFQIFTWFALFGSLLVAALASWLSFRMIVGKPLHALLGAIQRTKELGTPVRVAAESDDELGTVVKAFNDMQGKLEDEARINAAALRRLDYVYNDTPALMFSLDQQGRIRTVSGHWIDETGWTRQDVANEPMSRFLTSASAWSTSSVVSHILSAPEALRDIPMLLQCKDGSQMDVLLSLVPDIDDNDTVALCVLVDISGLKAAQVELQRQAVTDHLTGLPNRQGLFEHLAALKDKPELSQRAAMLFIDLDGFKAVNDTHGHEAGDELLRAAASRFRNCISDSDILARLGGDEFAIVLHGLDAPDESAHAVAERILLSVAHSFRIGEIHAQVGASIGIAKFTESGNVDDILRLADLAMYKSKQSGKNCISQFSNDLTAKVVARDLMVRRIRDALAHEHFRLFLQPIVDLETLQVKGAEALLRMDCPNDGLVAPAEIIRVAEESGLIGEITAWAVAESMRLSDMHSQKLGHVGRYMSVNLSPKQMTRDFIGELTSRLRARPDIAKSLVFEVTETALFSQEESAVELMHALRRTGARIALDDFGTGYSSLGHIHRFPVDIIKLDRSFVKGLNDDDEDARRRRALIRATAALASELGVSLVAEGIEDEQSFTLLRGFGVGLGQGFFFSTALPVPQALAWIEAFGPAKPKKSNVIKMVS